MASLRFPDGIGSVQKAHLRAFLAMHPIMPYPLLSLPGLDGATTGLILSGSRACAK